jgi:topoisomerase-4 subunit A
MSTLTHTNSKILVFCKDGMVYRVPAVMLQNLDKKGLNIKELWEDIDKNKIIEAKELIDEAAQLWEEKNKI